MRMVARLAPSHLTALAGDGARDLHRDAVSKIGESCSPAAPRSRPRQAFSGVELDGRTRCQRIRLRQRTARPRCNQSGVPSGRCGRVLELELGGEKLESAGRASRCRSPRRCRSCRRQDELVMSLCAVYVAALVPLATLVSGWSRSR